MGRFVVCLILSVLGWAAPGSAQLSPGPLSAPHADLEGSAHCLECHSSARGVDPQLCLSCHQILAGRIAAGKGLHSGPDYADCKSCHIDHHGRDFELVWWGEEGIEAFDHELTGHRLEGRHAELRCRDCHRADLNRFAAPLRSQGKNLQRTFLGLGTECLACHQDEHRGQFEANACLSCHSQSAWLPADGFRHEKTRFELSGLHRRLECEECHTAVEEPRAGDAGFLRFADLEFDQCVDCHDDPHAERLGSGCEQCHTTAGWRRVDTDRLDHARTRYPLLGEHRQVACENCHRPGAPKRGLRFGMCTDCHVDEHAGQFAARSDGGACESCHTVDGFTPTLFTLSEHDEAFALQGAHRDVACDRCHLRVEAESLVRDGSASLQDVSGRTELLRFRFASTACQDCHEDPHAGTTTEVAAATGCTLCHDSVSWQQAAFDHSVTDFQLLGPHAELRCDQCHVRALGESSELLEFSGLGVECASCHEDEHRGQFARADGTVDCLSCHRIDAWLPASGFDHHRDSEFDLEGAHARVDCEGCHRPETVDGEEMVRYKPLARSCSDCHGGG